MAITSIEAIEFELGMIRACLMLNQENSKLSPEEMDKLVAEEYKESRE